MSPTALSRRQFLSMGLKKKAPLLRPPWAMNESLFLDVCTRCGDCIDSCPENILKQEASGNYPFVDFILGQCTFCQRCVDVCPTQALNGDLQQPWVVKAHIGATCLATQHVVCRTCGEQCEAEAIQFIPGQGGVSLPNIQLEHCTGCGACVAPCPMKAIEVHL